MISIRNLSKVYKIYPRRGERLKEWLSFSSKKRHREFWALKDVNLDVPKGCVYGIVGMNGAGKSTLLKILTGTAHKTSGEFSITGRVAALLELGTGFHPELTGRENVRINGKLLGLSDAEITQKMDSIKDFSELGDYFNTVVRTYSSGMYVRLAFALAASVEPEVLIIDEALSVGDAYFQQKCVAKIREFKKKGVTILFVSHDLGIVSSLCDKVSLLDQGKIVKTGSPIECLELYNALSAKRGGHGKEYIIKESDGKNGGLRYGNEKAVINKVSLLDAKGGPIEGATAGQKARILVEVKFNEALSEPTVGILIKDRLGNDVFGTNTANLHKKTGTFTPGQTCRFYFDCSLNLGPGSYTISAAIHSFNTHIEDNYQWADRILSFQVLARPDYDFLGTSMLEPVVEVIRNP